ncbi:hypothetical protein, partial [Brachybacterium sp. Marseille-Q7125]|uniref:hypothetical protein n=1 Tax=Brachybacterium sp. Marseille-Q7125 TaxID=2932815 RepID=UPI001FF5FD94
QIESGNQQIEVLKNELENKMLSVNAKMNLLIQEIIKMKEDEQEDIEELKKKQAKLEEQMKTQLILSGIQSALSLLTAFSGVGPKLMGPPRERVRSAGGPPGGRALQRVRAPVR